MSRILTEEQRVKARIRQARYREANRDKLRIADAVYKKENREKVLISKVEYYQKNKEHAADYNKKYKEINVDRIKAKSAEYRRLNADSIKVKCKEYREINQAKLRAYKWHKINPAKCNGNLAQRRARKLQATPAWADEFLISEAYHLAELRKRICGGVWHVDHIVPLTSQVVCGLHCGTNLQVIPGKENISKGNRYWPDMPTCN